MELLKEIKTLLSEIGEEGGNCFVHSFTFMLLHHILPSTSSRHSSQAGRWLIRRWMGGRGGGRAIAVLRTVKCGNYNQPTNPPSYSPAMKF